MKTGLFMQKIFTPFIKRCFTVCAFILFSFIANAQVAGGGLHFDGVDDYVNVPNVSIMNQLPLTLEAWVKPEVRNDGTVLQQFPNNVISNDMNNASGHGFGVNVLSNNVSGITVDYNDGATYIPVALTAGQWYHVAVVYTSGNVKTYLNGTLIDNTNYGQASTTSETHINIGKFSDDISYGTTRFFKGTIDEVRVWSRALCQGEIINNMQCQLNLPQNGLFSYYKFNQGLAGLANPLVTTLTDAVGSNNGTLYNFGLLLGNTSNWVAGNVSGSCSSYSIPPATITAQGPTIFCQDQSVTLSANFANGYQWYNFGTAIPGATLQTYIANQTGQYTVEVTTGNCAIMSAVTAISVNPNPNIFISSSASTLCAGTPVSLSASGNNNAVNAALFNTNSSGINYATIPHQAQLSTGTNLTVEVWARPTAAGNAGIISKLPLSSSSQTGFAFKQTASNKFQFVIGKEGAEIVAESGSFTVGPWYHLTGTYDGSSIKIYVNGSLQATTNASGSINSTTQIVMANMISMLSPFTGYVDELRIWSTVKQQQQIQCDYKNAVLPNSAGLVGYWNMNDGFGAMAKDVTSYQNNGTLFNSPSWMVSSASVGNAYTWTAAPGITNPFSSCQSVTPAITTTYKVTGTNSAGCSDIDSVTITVFPSGQVFQVTGGGVACMPGPGAPIGLSNSEVGIMYQVKKGSLPVGNLVPGIGGPMIIGYYPDPGTYTVVAVNDNCVNNMSGSVTVTQSPRPVIASANITHNWCYGANSGAVDITVNNGVPSYNYQWSNNAVTQDIQSLTAGNYSVVVTDQKGCTAEDTFTVLEPTPPLDSAFVTNVSCFGFGNGSINIKTGGKPPHTFSWSNNATTEDIFNLVPGNYSVIVTDSLNCISNQSFTITQPALLTVSAVATSPSCFGGSNGSIDLTVAGGTAPYTYQWNNNATVQDPSGLAAGIYSVTVTDKNGCVATGSYTVGQPTQLSATAVPANTSCFSGNNGGINLTVSGGTPGYTYLWSNNATTEDISNLNAGNYSVQITDSKGCVLSKSATVGQPTQVSITGNTINVACNGAATGAVDITVTGGTPGYTYLWSNNATTQDINNVAAGTYSVTAKDSKGCTATSSFTLTEPTPIQVAKTVQSPSCYGGSNGSIDITVSNGSAPYTYLWSNNATTQDVSNLSAGTYTVIVTDANGCSRSESITVNNPAMLVATATPLSVTCDGNNQDAAVILSVAGGAAPYTYLWSNNATTQNLTNLPGGGTYSVTVTDANGCTATASATIPQPIPVAVSGTVSHVSCYGGSNGSINLTPTSGIGPFTYAWSNNAITEDLSNLNPGTYTVTITDSRNCTSTASFTVSQPAIALVVSETHTNNLCYGAANGSIDLAVSGGGTPYTYQWSNNATTQDISNLTAGTYTVVVIDANGCVVNTSATITAPSEIMAIAAPVAANCYGQASGAVYLTVGGGVGPYTYNWSNGATIEDITNVVAGTYTVTIKDANNCTKTLSAVVGQPAQLNIALSGTNVSCNGGSNGAIDLTVSGGTSPYIYNWSNGAASEDISGLTAGSYGIAIMDFKGCIISGNKTITEPAPLTAVATVNNVLCNNGNTGAVSLAVDGGTAPYTYSWNNGAHTKDISGLTAGVYSVTVTDSKGCTVTTSATVTQPSVIVINKTATNISCFGANNGAIDLTVFGGTTPYTYIWNNNATTQDLNNLADGFYMVTVTDANGCTTTNSTTLTAPSQIVVTGVTTPVTCNGGNNGAVDITVSGGAGSYTYAWSNTATTQDITNVAAGSYAVTVKDANNCIANASYTISQPTAITATAVAANISCNGANNGSVALTVSGGTSPYTYNWSNNATTKDITNLAPGTYSVMVTDSKGCTQTASATVTQPAVLSLTKTANNASCAGGNNGNIDITVTGGTTPYTYSWSNSATTQDLTNIAAGTYTVTVTDAKGCTLSNTTTITAPSQVVVTGVTTSVSCNGGSNGAVDITVTGGTAPYTYLWNNTATTQDITNLTAGNYSVTVKDANNCTATASYAVGQPTVITAGTVVTNASCGNVNNGAINLTVSGGTAPYTYSWSNNATTEDISNLAGGTYTVTITDAKGCIKTASATVTQPSGSGITITGVTTNASCNGNNGAINITVTGGGSGTYTYAWSNNATTEDINNIGAGTYTVTVTNSTGCSASQSFTLTSTNNLTLTANLTNVSCNGDDDGAIDLSVSGGTGPYTYNWNLGSNSCSASWWWSWWWWCNNYYTNTSQDQSGLEAGTYTVTVTSSNGCTATATYTITEPPVLVATGTKTNVTCNGANNGTIDLTVSGGTAPYTYSWCNSSSWSASSSNVTTQDRTGLGAGNYTVKVTDANGCIKIVAFNITEPSAMNITGTTTNVNCYGANTGAVNISVSGGAAPYTYNWTSGATTQDISGRTAGTYTVTVTDANGCVQTKAYTITQPASPITISAVVTHTCSGGNTGSIDLTVTGGTGSYSYLWSNNSTSQDRSNLYPGTYTVTVTDSKGCTATATYTITQPSSNINITGVVTNLSCNDGNNGAINITVSGGATPYTYSWCNSSSWSAGSGNVTTEDRTGIDAGQYTVQVTDANGCKKTATFTVTEPTAINGNISVSPAITVTNGQAYTIYKGYGPQSVTLSASASGGTPGYSYSWSGTGVNGQTSASVSVSPSATTTYYVTITDNKGCTKTISRKIEVIDVRCGNNENKVLVCHNGNTICVSQSAVAAHLAHGCYVGECDDRDCNNKPGEGEETGEGENDHSLTDRITKAISVYPNPTQGAFVLELPAGEKNASIIITDMAGKLIERRVVMGENQIGFDIGHLATGTYMIQVMIGADVYNSRITLK